MTIHISSLIPWVVFAIVSAWGGGIAYLITFYPRDPTLKGWACWAAAIFIGLSVLYATYLGWMRWE